MVLDERVVETIKANINGRKLVLRWRDITLEKALQKQLGIVPEFYVTSNPKRIDEETTFGISYLDGKSDELFLVVTADVAWSQFQEDVYIAMGYEYEKDVFWMSPRPKQKSFFALKWDKVDNADGYEIMESAKSGEISLVQIFDKNATDISIPYLNKERQFRVVAFKQNKTELTEISSQTLSFLPETEEEAAE